MRSSFWVDLLLTNVVVAFEVASDALEEQGDSTELNERPDTLGAPRDENIDLTNNDAKLHLLLFMSIEYSIGTFVLNKYI